VGSLRRDLCEHAFVTSQGSAYGRFRRALGTRNPTLAFAAARQLPSLSLADAHALCADDPPRYRRAAGRWHTRFCAEARNVSLTEAQLALAALEGLADPFTAAPAAEALAGLCEKRGLDRVAAVLDGWGN
jgi:hypothetical protein